MNLIGITGLKTSGKDTTFEAIRALTEGEAVRRAFADKLKLMAGRALGLDGSDESVLRVMDDFKNKGYVDSGWDDHGLSTPAWQLSGREYLQIFGQRAREVFGDGFWLDQVLPVDPARRKLLWCEPPELLELPKWGVVTDVRYPNEAARVLDLGGEVWEIVRPGLESDGHSSEIPLPRELVTREILNNSTIHNLGLEVEHALRNYTGGGS